MPNSAPRPWRMFLPLGVVLLLALLWSGYWLMASANAKQRLAELRGELASEGLKLACTQEHWGGYPFHLEFTCTSPILNYGSESELRAANLLLVALAYAPWQIAALVDGPSTITAPGLLPTQIMHQRALGAVTIGRDGQPSISAELPAVSVDGFGRAEKVMLFTRPASDGATDVAVQAKSLVYTPVGQDPLAVDVARLQGTLESNETLTLQTFEINQDTLRYWGSGKLSLDQQGHISGQIDTETNDVKALLVRISPLLGLSEGQLANLRTVLSLIGNGAKVPIIAKDGKLYLGPFQIAELKQLY